MVSSSVTLNDIASKLERATPESLRNDYDSVASDLLARLEGDAAALPASPARAHLFASLAVSSRRLSDTARANKLVNRAMNSTEKLDDIAERIEALSAVAVVLAQGDLHEAAGEALARASALARAATPAPRIAEPLPELEPIATLEPIAQPPAPRPARNGAATGHAVAAAPVTTGAASGSWKAPRKEDIDEGEFVDPVANVKFPERKTRRR